VGTARHRSKLSSSDRHPDNYAAEVTAGVVLLLSWSALSADESEDAERWVNVPTDICEDKGDMPTEILDAVFAWFGAGRLGGSSLRRYD
jgi:hypothetical protein